MGVDKIITLQQQQNEDLKLKLIHQFQKK